MVRFLLVFFIHLPIAIGAEITSANFNVNISNKDIVAKNSKGEIVLSLKRNFDDLIKKELLPNASEGWEYSQTYQVMSLVGPYLTVQSETSGDIGGAHSFSTTTFVTYDLSNPKKEMSLLEWYSDNELATELMKDKILKKQVHLVKSKPVTLKAIAEGFSVPDDCSFYFSDRSVSSFAFYAIEPKGMIDVRLGLSHGCEVARGTFTQLGILLSVPAKLANAVKATAENKQCVFMEDAKVRFKDKIVFNWSFDSKNKNKK